MSVNQHSLDTAIASIQHILDRDYSHLEWRVLPSFPDTETEDQPLITVHARTRDFRYRCRISRPWSSILTAPTLYLVVADLASEAEHTLADLAAAS